MKSRDCISGASNQSKLFAIPRIVIDTPKHAQPLVSPDSGLGIFSYCKIYSTSKQERMGHGVAVK